MTAVCGKDVIVPFLVVGPAGIIRHDQIPDRDLPPAGLRFHQQNIAPPGPAVRGQRRQRDSNLRIPGEKHPLKGRQEQSRRNRRNPKGYCGKTQELGEFPAAGRERAIEKDCNISGEGTFPGPCGDCRKRISDVCD